ncbi:hypothetical protein HMPREF0043_00496 [Actinobaculum sp. oral taxon 183 str. F0552]|nr:hypothetical protein HMPREF0043_00496 [Actinobaculum sp. oral taxon 183 str. F0552]
MPLFTRHYEKPWKDHYRVYVCLESFLLEKSFHLRGKRCKMLFKRKGAFARRIEP